MGRALAIHPRGGRWAIAMAGGTELEAFVAGLGSQAFRARQLMGWLYKRGEGRFERIRSRPLPVGYCDDSCGAHVAR